MGRLTPLRAAGLAAVALLAVAAAGCGGGSKPKAGTTTPATTTAAGATGAPSQARTAALRAFQTCLAQHGVKSQRLGFFGGRPRGATGATGQRPPGAPGPTGPRGATGGFRGTQTAAERKAFAACQSKLPGGGRFGPTGRFGPSGGGGPGAGGAAFAKYTKCLQQHGVKFGSSATGGSVFRKASAACAKLRPSSGGGAPTSTGTAGP